jgi:hypothetical protein
MRVADWEMGFRGSLSGFRGLGLRLRLLTPNIQPGLLVVVRKTLAGG